MRSRLGISAADPSSASTRVPFSFGFAAAPAAPAQPAPPVVDRSEGRQLASPQHDRATSAATEHAAAKADCFMDDSIAASKGISTRDTQTMQKKRKKHMSNISPGSCTTSLGTRGAQPEPAGVPLASQMPDALTGPAKDGAQALGRGTGQGAGVGAAQWNASAGVLVHAEDAQCWLGDQIEFAAASVARVVIAMHA